MPTHVVRPGECTSSIAARHGARWQDVWAHADNATLRERRANPNVLAVGDELALPAVAPKKVRAPTGEKHRFLVQVPTVRVRIRLVLNGEPVATQPYRLEAAERRFVGSTDDDGMLEQKIPAHLLVATLVLLDRNERFQLDLGRVTPADSPGGASERLRNLGLYSGPPCTELTAALKASLRRFQKIEKIGVTGELDDGTKQKLEERHGC